jgi:hypothetical protein
MVFFSLPTFLLKLTQGDKGSQPVMKTRGNEDMNKMYKIKELHLDGVASDKGPKWGQSRSQ